MTATTTAQVSTGISISLRGVGKKFGSRQVLRDLTIDIAPGEFVAIVGRSGCGKSTLLRLLAGLEQTSSGLLEIEEQPLQGLRQDTRIMFQDARLLPWHRVLDNVTLGLGKEQWSHAIEVLDHVGLGDRWSEWPARLSGGQRQRVALARALVHNPKLLLLDEPLGALDALTRIEMHALIERLWQENGFTALLVTHDVQEAVALADRVILIEDGAITLDERIHIERPRQRTDARFAAIEKRILDRVLQHGDEDLPTETNAWPGEPAHGLRWAI